MWSSGVQRTACKGPFAWIPATSYHLRQLAEHGFIEDAPERGKGRERWWQAVDKGIAMDEDLYQSPDPAVRGAADLLLHEMINQHTRELSAWLSTRDRWFPQWTDHSMDLSDWTLRLTPERSRELIGRMHELLRSYSASEAAADDPEAEQVRLHTHVFPMATDSERP